MPLSINVGLSRKASRNFQSTGVSINVTAELDQALLANPQALQQQIGDLYAQAQTVLERQIGNMTQGDSSRHHAAYANGHAARWNGNGSGDRGYTNDNGNGRRANGHASVATESQRRAIDAIARRADVNPAIEAREVIGAELDDLSLRQASDLIDHLKSLAPAGNRNGH